MKKLLVSIVIGGTAIAMPIGGNSEPIEAKKYETRKAIKTTSELFVMASEEWMIAQPLVFTSHSLSWLKDNCNFSPTMRERLNLQPMGDLYLSMKELAVKKSERIDSELEHIPSEQITLKQALDAGNYRRLKEGDLAEKFCVRDKILKADRWDLAQYFYSLEKTDAENLDDYARSLLLSALTSNAVQFYAIRLGKVKDNYESEKEAVLAINKAIDELVEDGTVERFRYDFLHHVLSQDESIKDIKSTTETLQFKAGRYDVTISDSGIEFDRNGKVTFGRGYVEGEKSSIVLNNWTSDWVRKSKMNSEIVNLSAPIEGY
ncbi:hypothetical protein [Acinetobacter sp. YH12075]|uniref:hypothetical protein n=1 Tax=Acinetobacter sp. YH12075 TaxID=2601070 RepID=UPI0015D43CD9|nr:hypothetical protein [Acinetobacter sp. YH12075]